MYKSRITAWDLHKNHKSEDIEALLGKYTTDQLQHAVQVGHDAGLVVLDGKKLSLHLVKRYLRRTRLSQKPIDYRTAPSPWSRSGNSKSLSCITLTTPQEGRLAEFNETATVDFHPPSTSQSRISTTSASTLPLVSRSFKDTSAADEVWPCPLEMFPEPFAVDDSCNADDEEGGEFRRKRRKLPTSNLASAPETKALACPFYKHNPLRYNPQNQHVSLGMRYRTCAGPGWESISRLRCSSP